MDSGEHIPISISVPMREPLSCMRPPRLHWCNNGATPPETGKAWLDRHESAQLHHDDADRHDPAVLVDTFTALPLAGMGAGDLRVGSLCSGLDYRWPGWLSGPQAGSDYHYGHAPRSTGRQ